MQSHLSWEGPRCVFSPNHCGRMVHFLFVSEKFLSCRRMWPNIILHVKALFLVRNHRRLLHICTEVWVEHSVNMIEPFSFKNKKRKALVEHIVSFLILARQKSFFSGSQTLKPFFLVEIRSSQKSVYYFEIGWRNYWRTFPERNKKVSFFYILYSFDL